VRLSASIGEKLSRDEKEICINCCMWEIFTGDIKKPYTTTGRCTKHSDYRNGDSWCANWKGSEITDKFWLLFVEDGRSPTLRYLTLDGAKAAAERLACKERNTVFIFETLSTTAVYAPEPEGNSFRYAADALHRELLTQIDGLMDAEAGTAEAKTLARLAGIVEEYESERWKIEDSK
jgi:hypothetical protein